MPERINALWETYQGLSTYVKHFVKVSSIIYESIGILKFADIISDVNKHTGELHNINVLSILNLYKNDLLKKNVMLEKAGTFSCNKDIVDLVFREATLEPYFHVVVSYLDRELKIEPWRWDTGNAKERALRNLRIAYYLDDTAKIDASLEWFSNRGITFLESEFYHSYFGYPPDNEWFSCFSGSAQLRVLGRYFGDILYYQAPLEKILTWFEGLLDTKTILKPIAYEDTFRLRTLLSWWKGDLDTANTCIANLRGSVGIKYLAHQTFLNGHTANAILLFETALKAMRKETGRKRFFDDFTGMFYLIALLEQDISSSLSNVAIFAENSSFIGVRNFSAFVHAKYNQIDIAERILGSSYLQGDIMSKLSYCWILYWIGKNDKLLASASSIEKDFHNAATQEYHWIALEFATILTIADPLRKERWARECQQLQALTSIQPVIYRLEPEEDWMRSLNALYFLTDSTLAVNNPVKTTRLVWFISYNDKDIFVKEQSQLKRGGWGVGKNISLKKLKNQDVDNLTDHDRRVISTIKPSRHYYNEYEFDKDEALRQLVGHPLLFLAETNTQIELLKGEPELLVEKIPTGGYKVKFSVDMNSEGVFLVKESTTIYRVIEINTKHLEVVRAMGKKELIIPEKGFEKLRSITGELIKKISISTPFLHEDVNIETVTADQRIYVQLLPFGEGLQVETYVKPFGTVPPYSRPGEGNAIVIGLFEGKRVQASRDFDAEKQHYQQFIQSVEALHLNDTGTHEWQLDEVEICLQLLLDMEPFVQQNLIVLEWPKGEAFKIKFQANADNLFVSMRKQNDWFAMTGELKADDGTVMNMRELLDLVANSPNRFVRLHDGSFMALTKEFKKRLNEINAYSEKTKDGARFHPLASFVLDDFASDLPNFEADLHWKKQVEHIKTMGRYDAPIPSTLQADLRSYQIEGYKWLSQLAHWGVGACLADDMGLGKTLQAIAVVVARAGEGASLVVAPSSVCQNWINECQKFAPTLNPLLLGKGDRQAMIDELKPFEVVICSYSLLQQEADMLTKIQWQTVILDEAQAIKNYQTKRSKAAMELQAGFKIITTGTPIENHLGELWNLFNFINPGLLGTAQIFNDKFGIPISRNDDQDRRRQLQRLIQPFVLRRRKSQVLQDLPAKTEIVLRIEMSREEQAFYEALRQNAVQKLAQLQEREANTGTQQLQILAEIMRLRQAACNVQLIYPEMPIPSSKLQLFSDVVDELIDNGHKALVFSQFVGHLRIIEKKVQEKGIKYQYLDGSTPVTQRQKLVDAFQRGEGDLFLISLKAGGVGLNLTAADYVIIMDPWWNPAVEDQAADRAHRIGQMRPVTIYRLVTQNTIEEKIVGLHNQKRDLADSLLEGTEGSAKLNADDLMRLLSEV